MKGKLNKILTILMLMITIFSAFSNIVCATEITGAELHDGGDCGSHLQYWKNSINNWSYVKTSYVYYTENGAEYPAYCLESDLVGVGEGHGEYGVDVNSAINDVRLWRVALNGYPYQTPESMGVANKYDAFVATKQAIYSVIYGYDANSRYKGGDARGEAIKNAIVRLTNIGRNGTQTPANTDITVKKTSGFYEDGEYYSQNFIVDSPVETSQYTIIAINGIPEGGKITDLSNNEKSTFGGTEQFKVKIPKSTLDKDVNVTISVKGKSKTYPMFYGKTRVAGRQDYLLTYDPFGDTVGQTLFNVATNTGKIKINKTDDYTSKPIEGVTFGLYKDDKEIARATTDKNGEALFQGLYQGKYILKELSTNEKYILNETDFDVDVYYDKTTTTDIQNEHKKGNIKVYKVDKDNHETRLGNVNFDLYSEEFDKVLGSYATNVNGEIFIENLRIGNYKLIEKNTGKWYNLSADTDVQVKWNETSEVTIENEKKKGQIRVVKTDGETETPLRDVTFAVENSHGDIIDKITTDEKGEATTERLPIDDKYTIYEESTKKGYILSEEQQTVELEENEIKTLEFKNYKEKGKIKITKKSSDGKNIAGIEFKVTGTTITGEKFERTYKTDENGEIFIDEALVGEYTIEEIAGEINKDYEIPSAQKVTVEKDKTAEVEFYNKLKNKHVADKEIPNTGDNRNTYKYLAAFVVAGLGLSTLIIVNKKRKHHNR